MSNTLLQKKYYILESTKTITFNNNDCISTNNVSKISNTTDNQNNNPYTIFEVEQYISDKILNFSNDFSLIKSCLMDSRYGRKLDTNCTTFSNFGEDNKTSLFSDTTNGKPYTLKENAKKLGFYNNKDTNKKSLCQQLADITNLLYTFNNFIEQEKTNINNNKKDPTPMINLRTNYNNMLELRNKLDLQLQDLLGEKNINENKLQLDSTVYTSVLWTVLATSILYYVFIKI